MVAYPLVATRIARWKCRLQFVKSGHLCSALERPKNIRVHGRMFSMFDKLAVAWRFKNKCARQSYLDSCSMISALRSPSWQADSQISSVDRCFARTFAIAIFQGLVKTRESSIVTS
jgi:hypothetical protein